jgi:hypothetical protein
VEGYAARGELRQGFVLDRAGKPMKVSYEVHHGIAISQGDIALGRARDIATTPETARPFVRSGGVGAPISGPINATRRPSSAMATPSAGRTVSCRTSSTVP